MHSIQEATASIMQMGPGTLSHADGRLSPAAIALTLYGDLLRGPAPARQIYYLPGAAYVNGGWEGERRIAHGWQGPKLTIEARPTAAGGLTVYGLAVDGEAEPLRITWGLRAGWDWPRLRALVERMAEAALDWQEGGRVLVAA